MRNATRVGAQIVVVGEGRVGGVVGYVCGQDEVNTADAHSSTQLGHVEGQIAEVDGGGAAGCAGILEAKKIFDMLKLGNF